MCIHPPIPGCHSTKHSAGLQKVHKMECKTPHFTECLTDSQTVTFSNIIWSVNCRTRNGAHIRSVYPPQAASSFVPKFCSHFNHFMHIIWCLSFIHSKNNKHDICAFCWKYTQIMKTQTRLFSLLSLRLTLLQSHIYYIHLEHTRIHTKATSNQPEFYLHLLASDWFLFGLNDWPSL